MGEQVTSSSWLWRFRDVYDMLWKMVIRPPRDLYTEDELGPDKFRLGKKVFIRRDLELTSSRGQLKCSHFLPAKGSTEARPCVVYLHGNCSSRLEAFDALPVLLPQDVSVFSMDLSGSGRSDGEYISLGYHEEQDLRTCLEFLRQLPTVSSIGLWGRSMGASTSILRAAQDSKIAACVLDSAFKDLKTVADELVGKGRFPWPTFLTGWALDMVRNEVLNRANFDILELSPISRAPDAACPGFFGVASDDTFVLPHHTQELHNAWGGHKHFRVFEGGHNGVRPLWFLEEAADFLAKELRDWRQDVHKLQDEIQESGDDSRQLDSTMDTCEDLLDVGLGLDATRVQGAGPPCPSGCKCTKGPGAGDCGLTATCRNLITGFPKQEHYPEGLDCLFIHSPRLRNLPMDQKEAGFRAMPASLRRLDLSESRLRQLPGALFPSELRVLNLEFNELEDLPEDLFQGLGKLKVLWLTGNHYQPGEKGYKKMKAAGNRLEHLHPKQFEGLSSLQVLLLHHNRPRGWCVCCQFWGG
eukprot:symbB.v1.2.013760.t2/scaffold982.1/size146904/2